MSVEGTAGANAGASGAERELRAEVAIAAPPQAVWGALADLRRWPERSPELVALLPLKSGGLRRGQWYVGINRRKGVVWPTRNVVVEVVPERRLVWDTTTSGARWIFELEPAADGTRLVHRRPLAGRRLTLVSRIFARFALGGQDSHADELEHGMARTLAGIRTAVEA